MKMTVLDCYFAKKQVGEGGVVTYDTPAVLGGSAEVNVQYQKSPVKVYESGRAIKNNTFVSGATVTVQSHTVPLAKQKELFFGLTAGTDGEFEEGGDTDKPVEGAIGWPVLLDDGKYQCTWFYDASAAPPDESYKTSNDNGPQIEPESFEFSCVRDTRRKLRRTKICADATAMAAFFAAVLPVPAGG